MSIKKVKVLCLIDSLQHGGAEQSLVALVPHLLANGVEVEVATLHDRPGLAHRLNEADIPLHRLQGPGGRAGWAVRASRLVAVSRPALIHTTLYEADIAGRMASALRRVPVVTSLVNDAYGPQQLNAPRIRRGKMRAAQTLDMVTARRVIRFHAITHWVAEVMGQRLRIPRHQIDVVPRGRDPHLLGRRTPERRADVRQRLKVDQTTPLIVALARHEHQKGLDILLSAVVVLRSQLASVRLVIGGRPGNQTALLEARIAQLDLAPSVQLLGARDDVGDLLAAADVFVLPSRWEGLGSVLLEAMALEAPIVASDLAPVREILGGQALLVSPEQPDLLAAAVASTLIDPVRACQRAQLAHQRFLEHFTIRGVAEKMSMFYRKALRDSP